MPVTVTYIKNGGVLLKGEGVVSGTDIKQANNEIYTSPENLKKIRYQLCDYRKVSELLVSNEDIEVLSKQDDNAAKINPGMFIALVGELDLIYGLIRMWEAHTFASPFESMAFRNIEDAEKWIDEKIQKP